LTGLRSFSLIDYLSPRNQIYPSYSTSYLQHLGLRPFATAVRLRPFATAVRLRPFATAVRLRFLPVFLNLISPWRKGYHTQFIMDNKEVKKLQEQLMAKDCEVSQLREEIEKLKEELDVWVNPTGEVVMNREGMMLYEASQEENKKLKEQQELLKVGIRKELDILANSKSSYPATRSHTELQKKNEELKKDLYETKCKVENYEKYLLDNEEEIKKLKKENEELKENKGWWRHQIVKTLGWDEKEGAKWNAPYEHDVKVRDIFETLEDYIYLVRGGDKHDPETGEVIGNTPSLKEIKEENEELKEKLEKMEEQLHKLMFCQSKGAEMYGNQNKLLREKIEKLTKELELRDCGSKEEAIARGLMEENEELKAEVDKWRVAHQMGAEIPLMIEKLKKKIEKQDEIILIKDHEYDELKKNLELSEKLVKVEAELFEKVEWVEIIRCPDGWSVGGSGTIPDIFQPEEED